MHTEAIPAYPIKHVSSHWLIIWQSSIWRSKVWGQLGQIGHVTI